MSKSPFLVFPEFVSPYTCEDIVDACNFSVPTIDKNDRIRKTEVVCELAEQVIFQQLTQSVIPKLSNHYNIAYRGTERMIFEWLPERVSSACVADNSTFTNGKWIRTNARDLTGVLFLSDYQDEPSFDGEFEVYGGKLEFPQHQFGFNPTRGTLVIFPSDPHFIHANSMVLAGNLYQARFHITAQSPLIYNPSDYPGNYTTWF